MTKALPNCRSCARHATVREALRALFSAGRSMATSKAMIPMTTNSSTSVNAPFFREGCREVVILPPKFEATGIFGSASNFATKTRNERPQLYPKGSRLQDEFEEFWYLRDRLLPVEDHPDVVLILIVRM